MGIISKIIVTLVVLAIITLPIASGATNIPNNLDSEINMV